MSDAVSQALEGVYASLQADNAGIDAAIAQLKAALATQGTNKVEVDTARLVQPNREGRKLMQSYFRKRGVEVSFATKAA